MPSQIATLIVVVGIAGLFWLERDPAVRPSKALWIPTLWLLINGSRPVSQWLAATGMNMGPAVSSADMYLDGSPIDRNVFTMLLVAGLMVLVSRRQVVGPLLRNNGPVLVFFTYCALSTLWSDYSFVAFKHWTKGIGDVVMAFVVLTDREPEKAFKSLVARMSFLLIPLSVLFIKYYPDLGQGYNQWTWIQEYQGVTTTKNMLGMICLVCGLVTVWRVLMVYRDREDPRRTKRLVAHGIVLAMVIWLLEIANSMTSLSCFLMGSFLIAAMMLRGAARRPAVVHTLVVALVVTAFFALFLDVGGGLVESLGKDPTLTGRTAIWNLVLNLTGNPFIGTGYESFWLGTRLQKVWNLYEGIQEAHNGYLETYLNLGWIGVTLLAALIVSGYRNAVAVFQRDPAEGSIRVACVFVALVYNFTEAGFRMQFPVWILFLLATINLPELSLPESAAAVVPHRSGPFDEPELTRSFFAI
jgi:exopolysaccharide production protein ExoQ